MTIKLRIPIFSVLCLLFLTLTGLNTATAARYSAVTDDGSGAIATINPRATQAAMEIYAQGGNAVDAAVTAALTLGVVDGHNSGIGGGCFILIRWADGRIEAIDGREMAPGAAHRDMYVRNGVADKRLSKTGALAIGIPGSLAAYDYLLAQGGNKRLSDTLAAGIQLADRGFAVDEVFAMRLSWVADRIAQFPASKAVLLKEDGTPLSAGDRLVQKDLAETYRKIATKGINYFYRGEFAQSVGQWMQRNDGIVTAGDFENYVIKKREPLITEYRGYQLAGFPPPSSGGVHVAQILNILEPFNLAELPKVDRYHLLAEAMKLAFADRAYWLGDPDFAQVPKGLIDKSYAQSLGQSINMAKVHPVAHQGQPPRADVDFFGKHTTHISAADKAGNWVAITTTLNTSFGSKVMIPGTGVMMNNQMDDFSMQPGVANAFGLVGVEANSIQPGKRPLSSMSPTLLLKEGKPVLTLGAAGGPTIITQVVQGLVNRVDLNMSLAEALASVRVHHQWKPDLLLTEKTMPESISKELIRRGHQIKVRNYMGATQAISVNDRGDFVAVSEPRIIARNQASK